MTFSGTGQVDSAIPLVLLTNPVLFPIGPLTITFSEDKNYAQIKFATSPAGPVTFQAFDAVGNVVASGGSTGTIPPGVGAPEGTLTVSGPPFRRIVISSSFGFAGIAFDNLSASCNP